MIKSRFGKTELSVSCLGFGAAEIGYLKPERERAAQVMNLLLDEGVNVIDTAASYETSEEVIGQSIGHRRAQYVLIRQNIEFAKKRPLPQETVQQIRAAFKAAQGGESWPGLQ